MESTTPQIIVGLSDIQVQRVLICFLKEVFNGNLKLIDQRGWEEFEVLRVSANARQNWGLDLCMQMLYAANRKIKDQNKMDYNEPNEKRNDSVKHKSFNDDLDIPAFMRNRNIS